MANQKVFIGKKLLSQCLDLRLGSTKFDGAMHTQPDNSLMTIHNSFMLHDKPCQKSFYDDGGLVSMNNG